MPYTDTGDRTYQGREIPSPTFGSDVDGIVEKWIAGWLDDKGLVRQLRMEGLTDDQILIVMDEVMEA